MKKAFLSLFVLIALFAPLVAQPHTAHAVNVFQACSSVSGASSTTVCKSASAGGSGSLISDTLKTVFNILSFIIGVTAVIMLIVGGLKILSSGGDPANVKSGRDAIMYALIGLAVAALAQVMVVFVLNKV